MKGTIVTNSINFRETKPAARPAVANVLFCLLTVVLLSACTRVEQKGNDLKAALDSLRQQYAPDDRVAVFDLVAEYQGGNVVVKGDVDNPKAGQEAVAAVARVSGVNVLDSVRILPDPKLGENRFGIVAASACNVRTKPGHAQELCTQALMGTPVKLLKKQGGWYFSQLPDKYLGWIEESSMKITTDQGLEAWKSARKVIVTDVYATVRTQPSASAMPVSDAVDGMLMKFVARRGNWVEVDLPDARRGYIGAASVDDFDHWKQTRKLTPENLEKTAKLFIGVPYLWGGTSSKGMDCSGFAKTVYRLNGVELNRDADQQAMMGEPVDPGKEFGNLKKGDLLFFGRKASADKPERISHVGIYLEKGEFIHTPGGTGVTFNSFDPAARDYNESLRNRFVRARRLIGEKQIPEVSKN